MMNDNITVASANTFFSKLITAEAGFEPLQEAGILLLQEVINPKDQLAESLARGGFELIAAAPAFGLAIARHNNSALRFVVGSERLELLAKMSRVEKHFAQSWAGRSHDFTERGVLSVKFSSPSGGNVTISTAHLTVPFKRLARRKQLANLSRMFEDRYFSGPFIFGGDMNHSPGPTKSDKAMHYRSALAMADIGDEPTWIISQSKIAVFYRPLANLTRRDIDSYSSQTDMILYRGFGLKSAGAKTVKIESDHRAVLAYFTLQTDSTLRSKGDRNALASQSDR